MFHRTEPLCAREYDFLGHLGEKSFFLREQCVNGYLVTSLHGQLHGQLVVVVVVTLFKHGKFIPTCLQITSIPCSFIYPCLAKLGN